MRSSFVFQRSGFLSLSCAALLAACATVAHGQTGYTVSNATPSLIAAGSGAFQASATVTGTSVSGPLHMCFYTGYGANSPVSATVSGSGGQVTVTFPVAASTIQQIPPSAFQGGGGTPTFAASVYVADANATSCSAAASGAATVQIRYPTLAGLALTSVPDQNPNLTSRVPRSLNLLGANFLPPGSGATTTVSFAGGGVTAAGSVKVATAYSLLSSLPASIPPGSGSVSVTACNQAVYSYCAAAQQISLYSLAPNPGTLTITPDPPVEDRPATLVADFGPASPSAQDGAPGGVVTFSEAGLSFPAPLILDTTAQLLQLPGANTAVFTASGAKPFVADFNQDGVPDAMFLDSAASTFHILLGLPPFAADIPVVPAGNTCASIPAAAVGDFNKDGAPDIAFVCQQGGGAAIYSMLGLGDGLSFAPPVLVGSGSFALLAAGDFNHDGNLDLVALSVSSGGNGTPEASLALYTGQGDGTFQSGAVSGPFAASPLQVTAQDLNGDGAADLVLLASGGASGPGVYVFENTKDSGGSFGSFLAPTAPISGVYSNVLVAPLVPAQVDGTTCTSSCMLPSLVAVDSTNQQLVTAVSTSTATAISFAGTLVTTAAPGLASAAAADFNADGYLDLAISGSNGIGVLTGDGTGAFISTAYPSLADPSAPAGTILVGAQDENGDGFADLLALSSQTANGTSTFTETGYITAGTSHATLVNPFGFEGGTQTVTATTNGTYTIAGGTASVTFTVPNTLIWPSGALTATPPSGSQYGTGPTVITGTVTGTTVLPTGSAYFIVDHALAAIVPLSGSGLTATASYNAGILPAGTHDIFAFYSGDSVYVRGGAYLDYLVAKATPVVTWVPVPATIVPGTALSAAQLDATASVPGTFVYSPAAGTVLPAGTQQLSVTFTPTDSANYNTVNASATIAVANFALTSLAPNSASLGDPDATVVVTGSGFVPSSKVLVNGTAVATKYTSSTALQAVLPAADFLSVQTLQVSVANPGSMLSGSLPFSVAAPQVSVIVSGPTTTTIDLEPQITFQLLKPYPVDLVGTFTVGFAPAHGSPDDPSIRFESSGTNTTDTAGRTFGFTIPAHSTTTPAVVFQSGSTSGDITLKLDLSAANTDVTPSTVKPLVLTDPDQVPGVTSVAVSTSGNTLTVVTRGYSNTRELQHANFFFFPAAGKTLSTKQLKIDEVSLFTQWYSSSTSADYGSTFTYTQTFNLDEPAAVVGAVQVTLSNSVGTSALGSSF